LNTFKRLLIPCLLIFTLLSTATAGTPDPSLKLSEDETEWLREHGNDIVYAPTPNWPPGDFVENGIHRGIVSDYIKIFEQKLGIKFRYIYYKKWRGLRTAIMTGKLDLAGALQINEKRKEIYVFTRPFLTTRLAVLTGTRRPDLKSLNELNYMKIAGIAGYTSLDFVKSKYPGAGIIECDDDLTVMLKVSAGAADGGIVDYMMASYLINRYSITNIKYAGELDFHWDLRFAVNKRKSQLQPILDKVLDSMSSDEKLAIYKKWVGSEINLRPSFIEKNLKIILAVSLLIVILFLAVLLFNRYLQRQVALRTGELNENAMKLRESKDYLQAILDSTGDSIIIVDVETKKIVDANRSVFQMYGYSPEDIIDADFLKIDFGKEPFPAVKMSKRISDAGESGPQTFECMARHYDGRTFWVEMKITFTVIGNAGRFVVAVRDINRRKKIEEQHRQSQKLEAMGTLAGGIAHDFNNILAGMLGFTELSLMSPDCDPKTRKNLEHILAAIKRAKDLVMQILLFSRNDEESRKHVNIYLLVREAADLVLKAIPESVSLNLSLDDRTGTVLANPTQLHQVVMNLVTNAYQAISESSGSVSIKLEPVFIDEKKASVYTGLKEGMYALLRVSDSGDGMTPEVMERIFEPFFTTRKVGKGTGMGLAVVHGIVQKHHGLIWPESTVGEGTTMNVLLPLHEGTCDETPSFKDTSPVAGGNERIMFVDDEPLITDIGKQYLETLGYSVTEFTSPIEAIKVFRSAPGSFDLIVTDEIMPEELGHVMAGEAMKIRPDIPVIICTGFSGMLDEKAMWDIGIRSLLMKPLESSVLAREIRRVLDKIR